MIAEVLGSAEALVVAGVRTIVEVLAVVEVCLWGIAYCIMDETAFGRGIFINKLLLLFDVGYL